MAELKVYGSYVANAGGDDTVTALRKEVGALRAAIKSLGNLVNENKLGGHVQVEDTAERNVGVRLTVPVPGRPAKMTANQFDSVVPDAEIRKRIEALVAEIDRLQRELDALENRHARNPTAANAWAGSSRVPNYMVNWDTGERGFDFGEKAYTRLVPPVPAV